MPFLPDSSPAASHANRPSMRATLRGGPRGGKWSTRAAPSPPTHSLSSARPARAASRFRPPTAPADASDRLASLGCSGFRGSRRLRGGGFLACRLPLRRRLLHHISWHHRWMLEASPWPTFPDELAEVFQRLGVLGAQVDAAATVPREGDHIPFRFVRPAHVTHEDFHGLGRHSRKA